MSAWPYGGASAAIDLGSLHAALVATGAVSFLSILRPDHPPLPDPCAECFALTPLKPHYVFDPALPALPLSKKARRNLREAEQVWQIVRNPPAREAARLALHLFDDLAKRRTLSAISHMPRNHFELLLRVPGIESLALRSADGEWGGVVIAACDPGETHMLHILTSDRARMTNGAYLLMQAAAELWGRDGPLYLGGAPTGADSAGIARFKQRWANRQSTVHLLTAILDPARYAELAATRGKPGFFPAYRHPDGEAAERLSINA